MAPRGAVYVLYRTERCSRARLRFENMSDEAARATTEVERQHAYEVAVAEFKRATLPRIVALTAQLPPSAAEITREKIARVWAAYGQD